MKENWLKIFLKGLCVGGTMLVPGVSGGSMAMILGIYDKLITSVSSFFACKKRNALFLLLFALGGGAGMLLFANPLLYLLQRYPLVLRWFFIGAVAGVQYRFSYEGSNNVTVELYEYDLDNLNDEAQAVLDSVKANGTFTVIGQEVTDAYLSDSGKYLMIYKDTQTNEQNELHKQEIVEQFQGFKAE